jgi:hypothetical protein
LARRVEGRYPRINLRYQRSSAAIFACSISAMTPYPGDLGFDHPITG